MEDLPDPFGGETKERYWVRFQLLVPRIHGIAL